MDSSDAPVSQPIQAGRDVYAAARDLTVINNYSQAGRSGPQASAQVVVGDIPQQPPSFQPRADLLSALAEANVGVSVVNAITGMRGAGKTQLAATYARAKIAEGWRLIAWVNAEDEGSLLGGLAQVAEATGITDRGGRDAGSAVRHRLEADGDGRLIVFDNVTDADMLRPYIPAAGQSRVVITSNRKSVAMLGAAVSVDVFTQAEALAFLADRTSLPDNEGASVVAEELGYLPLALAQAAALIASQNLSYRTYLERLRALPAAEYLRRAPGQAYPRGAAEVVLLSLQGLSEHDPRSTGRAVLELLAVLSAAGVSRNVLRATVKKAPGGSGAIFRSKVRITEGELDRVLGHLAEQSLVTFSLDGGSVIAHRLTLRVVRETLARKRRLLPVCLNAVSALDSYAASPQSLSGDRRAMREFSEQVSALLGYLPRSLNAASRKQAVALLRLRIKALMRMSELADNPRQVAMIAEALAEDSQRVLGAHHNYTLVAKNHLARAYLVMGQAAQAVALFEETLSVRERMSGKDSTETLITKGSLAVAYEKAGRMDEAIVLGRQVLASRARVFGQDDPRTLMAQNNLAAAYANAGQVAEGMEISKQVTAARMKILGERHPDTMYSRYSLANSYARMGNWAEAVAVLQEILPDLKDVLGDDHPQTLEAANALGTYLGVTGDRMAARDLHSDVMNRRRRVLGDDHPATLGSASNLGYDLYALGDYQAARELLEYVVTRQRHVLREGHPDTAYSARTLADCERALGHLG